MKSILSGILASFLFIVFKLLLFSLNQQHLVLTSFPAAPLIILTFAAITWTIVQYVRLHPFSMLNVFKEGVRTGLVIAVLSSFFLYAYYAWIDTDYLEIVRIAKMQEAEKVMDAAAYKNFKNVTDFFNTPKSRTIFTLSGITIFSFLSALSLSVIARFTIAKR